MARLLLTVLALFFVGLICTGSFMAEGVVSATNVVSPGTLRIATKNGRLLSWGAHQIRPGRVYWHVALG